MSSRESQAASSADPPSVACANCGSEVDALRAPRVRFVAERFCYFCSAGCDADFAAESFESSRESRFQAELGVNDTAAAEPIEVAPESARVPSLRARTERTTRTLGRGGLLIRKSPRVSRKTEESAIPAEAPSSDTLSPSEVDRRLLRASVAGSILSVVLLLAVDGRTTLYARLGLTFLASSCLAAYAVRTLRRRGSRYALPPVALVAISWLLALTTALVNHAASGAFSSFIGTQVAFSSITLLLLERYGRAAHRERAAIVERLEQPTLRVKGDHTERIAIGELRPGEEIIIHAGEVVVADVTVVVGRGEVQPWMNATTLRSVQPGDFIYAGARLKSGQLRATVRWTGVDRHWRRLTGDPARRADRHAPIVDLSRKIVVRGSLGAVALTVAAGIAQGLPETVVTLNALAVLSVLLNPAIFVLPAIRTAEAVLETLRNGIVIRSASVLEAAGKVSTAVFCARGTLLLGEPELSAVEALAALSEGEILSLVAGAEQIGDHPVAVAVFRAARARGVAADAVRSPRAEAGLGVTALTSSGKALVVGSRALMLRERISVARAEARITELEAMGRTVLLVAVAQHLVGVLAFQDGLRTGARAAVQHLLDVGIEPILLSGDGRETCEALGRAIDIDHIRPEVLPNERGHEVERLRNSGAVVAVVGRSPVDDVALGAASISVALPSTGSQGGAFDIELAGDEVQKAAVALRLLHRCRVDNLRTLGIVLGGALACTLGVLAVSAPPALIPAAGAVVTWLAAALLTASKAPVGPRAEQD